MDNLTGQCRTCLAITDDPFYVFCSGDCQKIWYYLKEWNMGNYDIDGQVYDNWLREKTQTIESMTTREEIENRITEIKVIEFYAKREAQILHQRYAKLTNNKGIPLWRQLQSKDLITEPNIKVDWNTEPRPKKEKKAKEDKVKNLLGFDIKELTQQLKNTNSNSGPTLVSKKEESQSMDDALAFLISGSTEVVEEKPKATEQEIKAKADALKEKMRLAKIAKTGS